MNKINYKVLRAAVIMGAVIAAAALAATLSYAAEPGSSGDPIALKSYVDSKIAELENRLFSTGQDRQQGGAQTGAAQSGDLAARIAELENSVARLSEENESLRRSIRQTAASLGGAGRGEADAGGDAEDASGAEGESGGSPERFVAIEALAEQRIFFGAGAEFVLRSGKALAIRGELGTLADLITGQDLEAGANVPMNHLILSPRDDNRGVRVSEDSWVLIKGPYYFR